MWASRVTRRPEAARGGVARCSGQDRGFTLIELLIVIAIIGIIAAMLIPNLLDSLQKSKQKRTMGDMHIVGTAMMSWLTDAVGAAAAGQAQNNAVDIGLYPSIAVADLETQLVPQYLQVVPGRDGWKFPYEYFLSVADPFAPQVMAIRSLGRDNLAEGDTYNPSAFTPTDYDQDIVWTDGFFIRWPQKLTN